MGLLTSVCKNRYLQPAGGCPSAPGSAAALLGDLPPARSSRRLLPTPVSVTAADSGCEQNRSRSWPAAFSVAVAVLCSRAMCCAVPYPSLSSLGPGWGTSRAVKIYLPSPNGFLMTNVGGLWLRMNLP